MRVSTPGAGARTRREHRVVGDGLVPSRVQPPGTSDAGDHKGRPTIWSCNSTGCGFVSWKFPARGRGADVQGTTCRRGRACPVPSPGRAGMSGAGDRKGRPYGFLHAIQRVAYLFHASFHPAAGPRTRREHRIVGDGLVPSRCQAERVCLVRATARVAPTDFYMQFNELRICSMRVSTPRPGRGRAGNTES